MSLGVRALLTFIKRQSEEWAHAWSQRRNKGFRGVGVSVPLHREEYSGLGAQREHSSFEHSCRSSKRGWHTTAVFRV